MVKHLSQDISSKVSNNHEELVALWLCLYFSQKIWTVEEIYEHLDFGQIQERLATLIGQNLLSNAEICCIFFGMKKITGNKNKVASLTFSCILCITVNIL